MLAACAGNKTVPAVDSASSTSVPASVSPQAPSKKADAEHGQQTYAAIVERIKARSYPEDFTLLRMQYTKTDLYQPFDTGERDQTRQLFEALDGSDLKRCVALADTILGRNFTSIAAHMGAAICHGRLGEEDLQQMHAGIYDGLINSIASTGSGSSPKTAFMVINTDEIYSFLQAQDLEVVNQALVHADGKEYDLMTVKDPRTGRQYGVYFDISTEQMYFAKKMRDPGKAK